MVVIAGRLGSRNSDGVGLNLTSLSNSKSLRDNLVARCGRGAGKIDSHSLGDGRRAVVRHGNNGRVSGWWRHRGLGGLGVTWARIDGRGARLAVAAIDGGCQGLGDVARSEVGRINRAIAALAHRCRTWDPGVGGGSNGRCDIIRRRRLGWCRRRRRRSVVASALARGDSHRAGGVRGVCVVAIGARQRADSRGSVGRVFRGGRGRRGRNGDRVASRA